MSWGASLHGRWQLWCFQTLSGRGGKTLSVPGNEWIRDHPRSEDRYLRLVLSTVRKTGSPRRDLLWENLALRQQLAVYRRETHRPRPQQRDHLFWTILARGWWGWRDALVFVQPETVIRWDRARVVVLDAPPERPGGVSPGCSSPTPSDSPPAWSGGWSTPA